MHDRDTYANPLAAPIDREPSDPETTAIEDVRHLAAMCRAQGRVDGIREERVRVEALYRHHARSNCGVGPLFLAAIRSGEAAP